MRTSPYRQPKRRTIASGRISSKWNQRPCSHGHHAGPFVRRRDIEVWLIGSAQELDMTPEYIAAIPAQYDCAACGSTIGEDQTGRAA